MDHSRSESRVFDHSAFEVLELKGVLLSAAPAIGAPNRLVVSGRYLWVSDAMTDPALHLLDTETGELSLSLGRTGEGPGEFTIEPYNLWADPSRPGSVWAWDPAQQRLTFLLPQPLAEQSPLTVRLGGETPVHQVAWLDQDRLVGVAGTANARFLTFTSQGELLNVSPADLLGPEEAPLGEREEASGEGFVACSWPGRGFAFVYLFAGRIEFRGAEAELVRMADVPFPSEPVFEIDGGVLRHQRPRVFYRAATATDKYLFALFAGRNRESFPGAGAFVADYVHVFDWEGELVSVLHLDRDVAEIAVDPGGEFLFAGSPDDASVYRFVLPPL